MTSSDETSHLLCIFTFPSDPVPQSLTCNGWLDISFEMSQRYHKTTYSKPIASSSPRHLISTGTPCLSEGRLHHQPPRRAGSPHCCWLLFLSYPFSSLTFPAISSSLSPSLLPLLIFSFPNRDEDEDDDDDDCIIIIRNGNNITLLSAYPYRVLYMITHV